MIVFNEVVNFIESKINGYLHHSQDNGTGALLIFKSKSGEPHKDFYFEFLPEESVIVYHSPAAVQHMMDVDDPEIFEDKDSLIITVKSLFMELSLRGETFKWK